MGSGLMGSHNTRTNSNPKSVFIMGVWTIVVLFALLSINHIAAGLYVRQLRWPNAISLYRRASRKVGGKEPTQQLIVVPNNKSSTTSQSQRPCRQELSQCSDDSLQRTEMTSSPYYLLWSPGMFRKFMISAVILAVFHYLVQYQQPAIRFLMPPAKRILRSSSTSFLVNWFHQVVLPLFASACCLIQLFLNALSIGCAGFNTILGPWRPYLISLLLYLSVTAHSSVNLVVWRWSIALLPEALHLWNQLRSQMMQQRARSSSRSGGTTTMLTVQVPTMGCVACINSIQNAVSSLPGVDSVQAELSQSGGKAVIVFSSSNETTTNVQQVLSTIEKSGFPSPTIIAQTEQST